MNAITDQLASASGQTGQEPNILLAQKIAADQDKKAVGILIEGLQHKTKSIRHDCIKTLYEIAALQPDLVSPFADTFFALLEDKDNRLQWGGMTAISAITAVVPDAVYRSLEKIIHVADQGSVITKDHAVRILVLLSGNKKYKETTIPLLLEQLLQAPVNQAPSYAEQTLPVISTDDKSKFEKILLERINDTEQESKRKRLEKVLKKAQQL